MKKIFCLFAMLTLCLSLYACSNTTCNHYYTDASCTAPKTCQSCGATEGSAIGHIWEEATCTTPKTCQICGATEGVAKEHQWLAATCTTSQTCETCGVTDGSAIGHIWEEATCTTPKTCQICGVTEGSIVHDIYQHKCRVCGYEDEVLGSFDVSANQDGSVIAYIYKTSIENEYALAFYGNGATKNFVTSSAPYNSLYQKIKHVEFGEGITRIGDCTLFSWDGWSLKSLKLPNTLIEIGGSAFERIRLDNTEEGLQLPTSLVRIGYGAFDAAYIGKLVIPDSVTYIGERAFCEAWITNITFGSGIKQIEEAAFSKRHEMTILDSLEKTTYNNGYYVGDENNPYYMFVGVTNNEITSIDIHPDTVVIYDRACMECIFLKSVTIPDSVKIICDMAFFGCANLSTVTCGTDLEYLNGYAFYNCSSLETVTFNSQIKFIGRCNFSYCYQFKTINFNGTTSEWKSIEFEQYWDRLELEGSWKPLNTTIICNNGTIRIA